MEETLGEIGVEYIPSEANFILIYSSKDLFRILLDRGILFGDCSNYRGLVNGCYRLAVKQNVKNDRILEEIRRCMTSAILEQI